MFGVFFLFWRSVIEIRYLLVNSYTIHIFAPYVLNFKPLFYYVSSTLQIQNHEKKLGNFFTFSILHHIHKYISQKQLIAIGNKIEEIFR